jgi:toxin ParE1/3/4
VTRNVRFHPLATAEVVEAQLWYEDRVDGLGGRFLDAVRAATDRAARWPDAGTPTRRADSDDPIERKVALAGFPYVVVYRAATTELQVLAVHHERRRPFYWAARANE